METEAGEESLADAIRRHLVSAGLVPDTATPEHVETGQYGDGLVVFRVGPLLLRIVRDTGEEFLDVGSEIPEPWFAQYDDVELALEWTSVDEVLARKVPEPIQSVLERVSRNLPTLQEALSGDAARLFRARVERAARKRGAALELRLRGR